MPTYLHLTEVKECKQTTTHTPSDARGMMQSGRTTSTSPKTFTEPVVDLISETTEATIPKTTVKSLHNQKSWNQWTIRDAINTLTAGYNLGLQSVHMDNYSAAAYNVRRAVKQAKGDYGKTVEQQFQEGNLRSMWQGLCTMTDYIINPEVCLKSGVRLLLCLRNI